MSKPWFGIILIAILLPFSSYAQNYRPGEVIVKLKSEKGSMSAYAFMGKAQSEKSMTLKESYGAMDLYNFALGKGKSVEQALDDLRNDPDVEYAEPNYYLSKTSDVGMEESFSVEEIEAYAAQTGKVLATDSEIGLSHVWSSLSGNHSQAATRPIVAVIDTGLDINHSVITSTNALWVNSAEANGVAGVDDDGNGYIDDINGWNFVAGNGTMIDDDGHGTHVTGIILSVDQDIFTTPRVESKVRIMPLKFLNGSGVGSTSDAIRAIYYAVNNGAVVLNNSWGGTSYSAALHDAVAYSYQAGTTFVAAAGNSASNNDSTPLYPASYDVPNVMAVAATTATNYLANFSNYGSTAVDLGSPGTSILSTIPDNKYGSSSGTSMAAPFVAGTAGQMKVVAPTMLGYQVRSIILGQIQTFSQLSGKVFTSGKLNSSSAVTAAGSASIESSQPSYKVSYLSSSREVASQEMGGCGMVSKMTQASGGGLSEPWQRILMSIGLILLPLVAMALRKVLSPKSRRKFERFKINSEVRISVGDRELVGSVSSISLGGAQLNTSALLQDGGLVTMCIESPDGGEKIEVGGRVVWSEENKAYGVAFEEAPQSVLSRISDWTKNLQKAA